MTEATEPNPKPRSELERLRALSQLPDNHLDNNFFYAVDNLCAAVEAMNITLINIEVDQRTFAESSTKDEIQRRWAVHLVIVRNMFLDIDLKVSVRRAPPFELLTILADTLTL